MLSLLIATIVMFLMPFAGRLMVRAMMNALDS
jgi:hypothetical protein